MSYAELEGLLKRAMGLDAASIGSSAVERAVQARMSACASQDLPAYAARARTSRAEMQALIEAIVVPETWFFRDCEAFAALVKFVTSVYLPDHAEGTLRLLSLPCSSGEEPYSMAIALLDAGIPAERFRIDALDISAPVLVQARRAHYGKNSFRGANLAFLKRHFDATADGYRLHRRVREQVNFIQANLLDAKLSARARVYDFIFCRNLLIYFDRDTQDRAVRILRGLLAEQGVLFVGPSESGLLLNHDFESIKFPLAFAFRARPAATAAASGRVTAPKVPITTPTVTPMGKPVTVAAQAAPTHSPTARRDTSTHRDIDVASQLADQGELEQAAKWCQAHVLRHGPSAKAYYLMGMIGAASGNLPEADQCYRKALYLDPNHSDALMHLALLLETRGSHAEAKVLRARLSRLGQPLAMTHEP